MDCSGIPLKTSSQEEHARLSTKLFDRCCAPASQALCLRGRGRAKLKELCTQPGLLFLTACFQQGSDKEKETDKPEEQEDKETEKQVEQEAKETERPVEQEALVLRASASPAKQQLSLVRMFGWGSGASQTAVVPVEKPMKTAVVPVEKPSYNVVAAQNGQKGGLVSGRRRRNWLQMRPYGAAAVKLKNLTGQQKVFAIEMVDASMQSGFSKNKSMEKTALHMGISLSQIKRLMKAEEKEYWLTWAKQEDRRGREREGTVRRRGERLTKHEKGGTDRGCRRPRKRPYLGPEQQARGLVEGVKHWADEHEELGFDIFASDLYHEYYRQLKSKLCVYQDEKNEGTFNPDKEAKFKYFEQRLQKLDDSAAARLWQREYLAGKCGMLTRSKQRVTSLSTEQEGQLVMQGWDCWDSLLWKIGCGSEEDLKDYVADAARLCVKSQDTVVSLSDQIPVWIKCDGEKCLVRKSVTTEGRLAKRRRKSRVQVAGGEKQTEKEVEQPQTTKRTPGNTANSRYRVTLIARQLIHNYFRPAADPQGSRGSRALHN